MAKPYLIRLSVYPYIRKYLLYHYSEPFFVTERGYISDFLINALQHHPKVSPDKHIKKDKIVYGEFVGIYIGETTAKKLGMFISSDRVKRFNEAVLDLIYHEMYRLIFQLKKANYQVDDTIREFISMYDFTEDEFPFDNAKRWYYRERERVQQLAIERIVEDPQFTLNFFEEVQERTGVSSAIINQLSFTSQLATA